MLEAVRTAIKLLSIPLLSMLLTVACTGGKATLPVAGAPSLWRVVEPPQGLKVSGAQWIEVNAPKDRKILAAVFRPEGAGPFPVVVFLHSTQGFRQRNLQAVKDLAQEDGLVVVAGTWFGGHYAEDSDDPTTYEDRIEWPNTPDIEAGIGPGAFQNILALVTAARTLPGVRPDRVGLFGHSRGSEAALSFMFKGGGVQAVAAWAGYTTLGMTIGLEIPVLILQGTADPEVPLTEAQDFEGALRSAGYPVEAAYYEGAPHELYELSPWREDAVARVRAFFKKYLLP